MYEQSQAVAGSNKDGSEVKPGGEQFVNNDDLKRKKQKHAERGMTSVLVSSGERSCIGHAPEDTLPVWARLLFSDHLCLLTDRAPIPDSMRGFHR